MRAVCQCKTNLSVPREGQTERVLKRFIVLSSWWWRVGITVSRGSFDRDIRHLDLVMFQDDADARYVLADCTLMGLTLEDAPSTYTLSLPSLVVTV